MAAGLVLWVYGAAAQGPGLPSGDSLGFAEWFPSIARLGLDKPLPAHYIMGQPKCITHGADSRIIAPVCHSLPGQSKWSQNLVLWDGGGDWGIFHREICCSWFNLWSWVFFFKNVPDSQWLVAQVKTVNNRLIQRGKGGEVRGEIHGKCQRKERVWALAE